MWKLSYEEMLTIQEKEVVKIWSTNQTLVCKSAKAHSFKYFITLRFPEKGRSFKWIKYLDKVYNDSTVDAGLKINSYNGRTQPFLYYILKDKGGGRHYLDI